MRVERGRREWREGREKRVFPWFLFFPFPFLFQVPFQHFRTVQKHSNTRKKVEKFKQKELSKRNHVPQKRVDVKTKKLLEKLKMECGLLLPLLSSLLPLLSSLLPLLSSLFSPSATPLPRASAPEPRRPRQARKGQPQQQRPGVTDAAGSSRDGGRRQQPELLERAGAARLPLDDDQEQQPDEREATGQHLAHRCLGLGGGLGGRGSGLGDRGPRGEERFADCRVVPRPRLVFF